MTAMSALVDPFTVNDLATLWANTYGGVTVAGGSAVLPCDASFSALQSTLAYSLAGSFAFCQMIPLQGAGAATGLLASPDFNNGYLLEYNGGLLQAYTSVGGVSSLVGSTAYSPTAHAWCRLRENAGSVFYDTAPDGRTWSTQWTSGEPVPVASLYAIVFTETTGTAGTTYIDNFNVAPPGGLDGAARLILGLP
jgi:hypothetical protein